MTSLLARCLIFIVIASILFPGCRTMEMLSRDLLHPPEFLEERRKQDEWLDADRLLEARKRAGEMLVADQTPAHLVLAARVEEDPEKALALLEEALEKNPFFAWARYGLAYIVLREEILERYEESAEHLKWLIIQEFGRDSPRGVRSPRHLLIENLHRLGRIEEEAEEWEALIDAHPSDMDARVDLARLLCFRLGETKRARKHLDKVLEKDPDRLDARFLRARVAWDRGKHEWAVELYEKLVDLHPDALLNIALLYDQHLKDPEKALLYYKLYLDYEGPNKDQKKWSDKNILAPNRIEGLEKGV